MMQDILYIKLNQNVEVNTEDVQLKDVCSLYCQNDNTVNKLKTLKITKFTGKEEQKKVISIMKIIQAITVAFPGIQIESIGDTDVLIERINVPKRIGVWQITKIAFVAAISFFGTCFSIMAFHNDIGILQMFNKIQSIVIGSKISGISVLEVAYSLGLFTGIILFFNHVGGRRITKDPTPIEVEMRVYEKEINDALIETASREGKEIDVS